MASETLFYGYKHYNVATNYDADQGSNNGYNWDSSPLKHQNSSSSLEETLPLEGAISQRKRKRTKNVKNKEEMESQRMIHIAVERNRRRQMNDYLSILRSMMPPSYSHRGDQASIVGGAINYVKELEQLLQFLESHKPPDQPRNAIHESKPLSKFFSFPQYLSSHQINSNAVTAAEVQLGIADIEVAMVESYANIKVLSKRRPKQLMNMVAGFQSIRLTILHLNVTSDDQFVLYSFSVKVEEECQLTTVNEMASAVNDIIIQQQESLSTIDSPPHKPHEK